METTNINSGGKLREARMRINEKQVEQIGSLVSFRHEQNLTEEGVTSPAKHSLILYAKGLPPMLH